MRKTRKNQQHHYHIMGQPWSGNGHTFSRCMVAGCDYTVRDGVAVAGSKQQQPQAQQCAMFDVWGDGSVAIIPSSSTFKPRGLGFDGDA